MNKIHLYYGDGKGKTTAAVGLSVRACGAGMKVVFVQFLKDGTSSEIECLKQLGVEVMHVGCNKFTWLMNDKEKLEVAENSTQVLRTALKIPCDLLVLDELTDVYSLGLIDKALVDSVIKVPHCEIVITGHIPDDIFFSADYMTEMKKTAHPYDNVPPLPARKGIEF